MPSHIEKIDSEIKASMLAKDAVKLNTIRMLKSALKYYQIEKKLDAISDQDLIIVVQKQVKQHQDSIESYRSSLHNHLLEKEMIGEIGATSKAQMGQVMKGVMAKAAGRADGKSMNAIVMKLLGS